MLRGKRQTPSRANKPPPPGGGPAPAASRTSLATAERAPPSSPRPFLWGAGSPGEAAGEAKPGGAGICVLSANSRV